MTPWPLDEGPLEAEDQTREPALGGQVRMWWYQAHRSLTGEGFDAQVPLQVLALYTHARRRTVDSPAPSCQRRDDLLPGGFRYWESVGRLGRVSATLPTQFRKEGALLPHSCSSSSWDTVVRGNTAAAGA